MYIRFGEEYLEELFISGKCSDKKHRLQPAVVKNYIKCVRFLSELKQIEDIYPYKGMNFEVLTGDKKGVCSVRINIQYRLEFTLDTDQAVEPVVTVCTLLDITNHYK